MSIPKGWLDYTPMGNQIIGTRFICFKVPLTTNLKAVEPENQLTPDQLIEHVPNLGLIIDLTDTYRYYNPKIFIEKGVEHKKIKIAGHVLPPQQKHIEFAGIVTDFLTRNTDNEKLIGVHCTHGCNRTGLMLCSFLVDHCGLSSRKALKQFQLARGHEISRANYVQAIHRLYASKKPPPSDDVNDTTRSCQTDAGFWIAEENISRHKCANVTLSNIYGNNLRRSSNDQLTLEVNRNDLIPDGLGNFLVRVAAASIPQSGYIPPGAPHSNMKRSYHQANSNTNYNTESLNYMSDRNSYHKNSMMGDTRTGYNQKKYISHRGDYQAHHNKRGRFN